MKSYLSLLSNKGTRLLCFCCLLFFFFFTPGNFIPRQLGFEDTATWFKIFHRTINSQISTMNYSLQIICSFFFFFPEHTAYHIIAISHSSLNVDLGGLILFFCFPFSLIFFLHYDVISLQYPFTTKFQMLWVVFPVKHNSTRSQWSSHHQIHGELRVNLYLLDMEMV